MISSILTNTDDKTNGNDIVNIIAKYAILMGYTPTKKQYMKVKIFDADKNNLSNEVSKTK